VLARSRDGRGATSASRPDSRALPPGEVPRTPMLTGSTASSASYGNGRPRARPWLLSVGIPTSVAVARAAPMYRRDFLDRPVGG